MTFEEFQARFDLLQVSLELFRLRPSEPPATDEEISEAECKLGCKLNSKYRSFLTHYGGGDVGYCVIFSVNTSGHWNLVEQNAQADLLGRGLLAFSPNFCGDFYAFPIEHGEAREQVVFFDHETGTVVKEWGHQDVFAYMLTENEKG